VEAVAQDDERVVLTCRTHEDAVTFRTPYVIACGGARSDPLRAQLGLSFPGRTFEDYFLICDIRADIPEWEHERRFYFDPEWNPGRQVLIHPCPGSLFRIDWQVPNGFDITEEEKTGGIDRRIRHIIGDRDYEIDWQSIYRFHARHTDRLRVGRVLIAGDCAHPRLAVRCPGPQLRGPGRRERRLEGRLVRQLRHPHLLRRRAATLTAVPQRHR
jgi:pentachlorophenol monooxygenase/3-(3-hydroxy-phenyl)propionate hydroxylase